MADIFYTPSSTLREQRDYFGLETAIGATKIKCVASAENPTMQTANGPNSYGDPVVLDAFGKTATPSADYEVIDNITSQVVTLGTVNTANTVLGIANLPVCLGGLSISTQTGSAPKITANGQALFTGAAQLRAYVLPVVTFGYTIEDTYMVAQPVFDYGLSSVNANFPIEFTTAMPGGTMVGYDLHGGIATVDYTMNWYRTDSEPVIALNTTAYPSNVITVLVGTGEYYLSPLVMTTPVARTDPDGGYTQYTFQISFPLVGVEATPSRGNVEAMPTRGGEEATPARDGEEA